MRLRLLLSLPFFIALLGLQQIPEPKPDELVRRALANQHSMNELLSKYSYAKRIVSVSSNAHGKVTAREDRVYNYAPCGTKTCIALVSVNGAPPKPKELKEHEKAVQKEQEKEAKKSAADRKKEEDEDLFLNKDFLTVYDFSSPGTELLKGTASVVVEFAPKPETVALAAKSDKILTKLAGRMWIAEVDGKIVATEMHMVKPIKVWGGFAGAIKNMVVQQEYLVDAEGTYLPKKNAMEMELRVLLNTMQLSIVEEYSDFKRAAAGGAQ